MMNLIDRQSGVKVFYIPPEITVISIAVEGPVAASIDPTRTGPEWIQDDSRELYDGDIWLPV